MTTELKACPFCGNKEIWEDPINWQGLCRQIQCGRCYGSAKFCKSLEEAVEAWNLRTGTI
jgi:hypothetical protein